MSVENNNVGRRFRWDWMCVYVPAVAMSTSDKSDKSPSMVSCRSSQRQTYYAVKPSRRCSSA